MNSLLGGDKAKRMRDKNGRFRKKKTGQTPKRRTPKRKTPKRKRNQPSKSSLKKRKSQKDKAPKHVTFASTTPIAYGHVYSPSCGHCVNMQSDWDKLTHEIGKSIELHDIGDNHSQGVREFNDKFHTRLNFDGFPTIFKLRQRGQPIDYYDSYYSRRKEDFDKGEASDPLPYRSRGSIKMWLMG